MLSTQDQGNFPVRARYKSRFAKRGKWLRIGMQNEANFMQPSPHKLLKLLTLKSSESSENPRVGSSILSLGTI